MDIENLNKDEIERLYDEFLEGGNPDFLLVAILHREIRASGNCSGDSSCCTGPDAVQRVQVAAEAWCRSQGGNLNNQIWSVQSTECRDNGDSTFSYSAWSSAACITPGR